MDLSKKAYINTLDLNARMQAFENFFWGYIKATENEENGKFFHKMFLEFYAQNVNDVLNLPLVSSDVELKRYFESQLAQNELNLKSLSS